MPPPPRARAAAPFHPRQLVAIVVLAEFDRRGQSFPYPVSPVLFLAAIHIDAY
jgi:hypothetical protein